MRTIDYRDKVAGAIPKSGRNSPTTGQHSLSGLRVLVVDDERDTRELVALRSALMTFLKLNIALFSISANADISVATSTWSLRRS